MNNASLELGGTNWAEKDGNILGYSVGDTSGNFSPQEFTFARGSNLSATRIDRAGLIVKGRENVLLQSNGFDTTWGNANTTETSGQSGYDGSNDAWSLDISGGTDSQHIGQSVSSSGVQTFSVYAKANTKNWLLLFAVGSGNPLSYFDLQNGVLGTQSNATGTIESVGNGWYRCSMFFNVSVSSLRIYIATNDNNITQSSGSVLIQDAQLEQGLAASPYIESGATNGTAGVLENTPRLNYTTGVANPYLLLEPSRTNLVKQSEYFDSSEWGQYVFNGASLTRTFGYQSPEGNNNAYKFDVVVGTGGVLLTDNITVNPADSQTLSVWMKGENGGEKLRLALRNSSSGGTSAGVTTLTNEWVRYDVTLSTTVANRGFQFRMLISDGVSDQTIYVYGAQCEAGTYPTSYIPTYSVSATRANEITSKTGASDVIGQSEGTMFVEAKIEGIKNDNTLFSLHNGSFSQYLVISGNGSGLVNAYIFVGGVQQAGILSGVYAVGDVVKCALAYKANDVAYYINGVQIGTDTSATMAATSQVDVGNLSFFSAPFQGHINQAELYKERLTNAELATLTTI